MSLKSIALLISVILILSNSFMQHETVTNNIYTPVDHQQMYTAGARIDLRFKGDGTNAPELLITYNLGSTLISPQTQNNILTYRLPPFISHNSGTVKWMLLTTALQGDFYIQSNSEIVEIETYVGPPSIIAGNTDYSMVVSIPLDIYDNVQEEGTAVSFHYNKGILESQNISKVKNLIAHDYIYSSTAIGPILLAANSGNKFSKEFIVDVKAGLPVDFTLSRKLNHSYADGNQLATFSTSILKDSYGNTVSDGTLVVFYITTSSGVILQTTGTTIKGIATASMIHPEKADSWSVTAAVTGMASSNTINLEFQQVFDDYEIQLLEGNRSIIVGPLKSFMGQIIPDGVTVELKIVGQSIAETYLKQSYNGKVRFELNPDLIPKGNYDLNITAGGITKTFKKVSFE